MARKATSAEVPPVAREPLVKLLPAQREAFWRFDTLGMMLLLWRRQFGKTTTLSGLALRRMMERPHHLFTYASASLLVGRELILREAQIWQAALGQWSAAAKAAGMQLQSNADGLALDDFADIFEHSRLEARLYHDRTAFSRTQIIAPNAATARGFTGDVGIDEIGFIRDFRELWEAMEPIASRDPSFRVIMATTPPEDDGHYSYEIASPSAPLDGLKPSATGHWYRSEAGVMVHRVDVYDAALNGVKLYDLETRKELTPEEHRAKAINRDAWDRNYALIFKTGGTSAVGLHVLQSAMERGRGQCLAAEDDFPTGWRDRLGEGPVAVGFDVATTEKEKSNPSALAVVEQVGRDFVVRLIVRFKTADPEKSKAMVREALDLNRGRRPRRLCIDATSERYFATRLRSELGGVCPIDLVIASEATEFMGERMTMKNYLGNQLANLLDDARLALPAERWIKDDFRLVKKERGGFTNELDSSGNHGDTFDAVKLALHGLISPGGPVEAAAASVGGWGRSPSDAGRVLLNPFLKQHSTGGVHA